MEIKSMNIYQKLSAITSKIEKVSKDLNIQFGKNSYRAVGEGNILKAVKPLEEEYRIYSYPVKRQIIKQELVEDSNGRITYFERVETTYRFVNIDNPSEFIDVMSYGDGIDSGDKGVGKAMTYADKYALMKAYKIETGDDPDKEASKEYKHRTSSSSSNSFFNLSQSLKDRCIELSIPLANVAHWLGKDIIDLTDEDLAKAIKAKEHKQMKVE